MNNEAKKRCRCGGTAPCLTPVRQHAGNAIRAHSLRCPFCAGYRKRAAAAGRLLFFNAISSGRLFTELLGMGKTLLFCPVYSPFPRTVVYWCPGRPDASKPPERRPPGTKGPLNERGRKPRRFPTLVMDGGIWRWACRLKRNGRKWKTAATNETKRCWGCALAANGSAASLHAECRRRFQRSPSLPWMRVAEAPPDRTPFPPPWRRTAQGRRGARPWRLCKRGL